MCQSKFIAYISSEYKFICFSELSLEGYNSYLLELTRKMESNVFKILLGHLKHISGICQKNIPPFKICSHILVLTLLELF